MTDTTLAVIDIALQITVLGVLLFIVHQTRRLRMLAKVADDLAVVGAATLAQILRMSGTAADHSAVLASDLQAAHDRADAVADGAAHGEAADAASRSGDA